MCEFSDKLIAWLDQELPPDEAASVERHLQACAECRRRVSTYEQVSSAFATYCDREAPAKPRRNVLAPAGIGAALAASVALWFVLQRPPVAQLTVHSPAAPAVPAFALIKTPPAHHRVHRRAVPETVQWRPAAPAVEIAIPADAMFPPGAVPAGFSYVTEVSFAADGSPQALRVWP